MPSRHLLRFPRRSALQHPSWKLIDTNYILGSRPRSPGAGSHSTVWSISSRRPHATVRNGEFDVASSSPRVRRYAQGRRSAGFTVPESAEAADVSIALRRRGWSPYALRLDAEQQAWIALVMDWQHAA